MLPVHIKKKLELFRDEEYTLLQKNEETYLEEKSEEGRAELQCKVKNNAIVIKRPEKNVLPYLDSQKKGARQCADVFIFIFNENSQDWELHIIEFKKTINMTTLGKSKAQLRFGIYNARALAAFLGFEILKVVLYSGYQNDNISSIEDATLIQLRMGNNAENVRKISEWKKGICTLNVDEENVKYEHKKIKLDKSGHGSLVV